MAGRTHNGIKYDDYCEPSVGHRVHAQGVRCVQSHQCDSSWRCQNGFCNDLLLPIKDVGVCTIADDCQQGAAQVDLVSMATRRQPLGCAAITAGRRLAAVSPDDYCRSRASIARNPRAGRTLRTGTSRWRPACLANGFTSSAQSGVGLYDCAVFRRTGGAQGRSGGGNTSEIARMCCDNGWSRLMTVSPTTTIANPERRVAGIRAGRALARTGTSAMAPHVLAGFCNSSLQSGTWGYARVPRVRRAGRCSRLPWLMVATGMCCDNG